MPSYATPDIKFISYIMSNRLVRSIMFTEIMPGMRFMRACLNAMHVGMVMDILVLRVSGSFSRVRVFVIAEANGKYLSFIYSRLADMSDNLAKFYKCRPAHRKIYQLRFFIRSMFLITSGLLGEHKWKCSRNSLMYSTLNHLGLLSAHYTQADLSMSSVIYNWCIKLSSKSWPCISRTLEYSVRL